MQDSAENTAALVLLSKTFTAGILEAHLGAQRKQPQNHGQHVVSKSTIFDTYRLAAAYNVIPDCKTRWISWHNSKRYDVEITLSVSLPHTTFTLVETAPSLVHCEAGLFLQFQTAIHHFGRDEREKENLDLDADLSRDFVDYYLNSKSIEKVEIQTQALGDTERKMKVYETQIVFSNGTTFVKPIRFAEGADWPTRNRLRQAEEVAFMPAAIGLRKSQPVLWEEFLAEKDILRFTHTKE